MSTVAYLGPAGTFTETAARLIVGDDDDAILAPCGDVGDVLRTVERGDADRGVVPIENALEGSVTATLDALAFDADVLIHAELQIPVRLVVAGLPGTDLSKATVVRSHPVALSSCRRWLSATLPDAERSVAASTAKAAAEVAAADGDQVEVAVVNPLAAERYGLEVLARDIADRSGNATRFVAVGNHLPEPTGWDKTSMVVFIESDRPGALLKLLEIFAERDLNLTKIESRPTKSELGDYCFFLDVEGHLADERVGDALSAVKRTQRDVKLLGSYRRSGARRADAFERVRDDDQAYRDAASWLASWRAQIDAGQ